VHDLNQPIREPSADAANHFLPCPPELNRFRCTAFSFLVLDLLLNIITAIGKMKAVVIKEAGKAELVNIKEQSMRPDYVKVKTVAVGVNPSTIFDILPMSDS
jgi:hypothetical protein